MQISDDETQVEDGLDIDDDDEPSDNDANEDDESINKAKQDDDGSPIEAHEDNDNDVIENIENTESGLRRSSRANRGTGVERLQMDFQGKSYSRGRALQFLLKTKSTWPETFLNHRPKTYGNKHREKAVQFLQSIKTISQYSDHSVVDVMRSALNVIFTQMSAKKGMKLFGESAVAAIIKELKQLYQGSMPGKPVVQPVNVDELSREVKECAMEAVNLIKVKRYGKVKGRTCANGNKQHQYLAPDETLASPTASLEGFITTLLIDAYEERDVAIFDVHGAYLHAEFLKDKTVLMRLRDEFVDIMVKINPEYAKYVKVINGRKVLYLRVLRAIYGCIELALLWYNLFSVTLVKMGFTLNPHDKCVANKMVNGSQLTIVWYVDDCKVSHRDPKVVTKLIEDLKKNWRSENNTGKETYFSWY